jgi:Zn-dependent peptidase ImmA (M78 family)
MNTVKKGDLFEAKSHELIKKAIEDEMFAFPLRYSKLIPKAKYFSHKRQKDIVFDLAIEIWPPRAKRFQNVFIIECKSYSTKKVPIGDLIKLSSDVEDVASLNGKAVFITNSDFTDTEVQYAINTGMMLIKVTKEDKINILLYKAVSNKYQSNLDSSENEFENFIKNALNPIKVTGLKQFSAKQIEDKANFILNEFSPDILNRNCGYELTDLIKFIKEKYFIDTCFKKLENDLADSEIIGYYDNLNNTITIDNSLIGTDRIGFVFAHELGHAILHKEIQINNNVYNEFQDSEYDFVLDKHLLTNYKNWIEWQANRFASYLLIPEKNLKVHLIAKQMQLGISKYGHIYLDNQSINLQDYHKIMEYLKFQFNTTKTTIFYRLQELGLITVVLQDDSFTNNVKRKYE